MMTWDHSAHRIPLDSSAALPTSHVSLQEYEGSVEPWWLRLCHFCRTDLSCKFARDWLAAEYPQRQFRTNWRHDPGHVVLVLTADQQLFATGKPRLPVECGCPRPDTSPETPRHLVSSDPRRCCSGDGFCSRARLARGAPNSLPGRRRPRSGAQSVRQSVGRSVSRSGSSCFEGVPHSSPRSNNFPWPPGNWEVVVRLFRILWSPNLFWLSPLKVASASTEKSSRSCHAL